MSIVAKIQNNEFPGFYSAIAQIDHPVWTARGIPNLIRHYAEEDANAVGSFFVFNRAKKIYERLILKSTIYESSVELIAFRLEDREDRLGRVYFGRKGAHYGPELPNGQGNIRDFTWILNINSYAPALDGLGTLLAQAALEFYPDCESRLMLRSDNVPHPHAFYYKLGARWAEAPNRGFDRELLTKAANHYCDDSQQPKNQELCDYFLDKSKMLATPDYDALILKEIEDARKEGRKADTSKILGVPSQLKLYFPDEAIKVWQKVIQERPVLYET